MGEVISCYGTVKLPSAPISQTPHSLSASRSRFLDEIISSALYFKIWCHMLNVGRRGRKIDRFLKGGTVIAIVLSGEFFGLDSISNYSFPIYLHFRFK